MTRKEFIVVEKLLVKHFSEFVIYGPLMLMFPVGYLLRGFSLEGSSFDTKSFYVNFFAPPLCVPTQHIYLNFGDRVRQQDGGDRWNVADRDLLVELIAAIKRQALPFLSRAESLRGFIELAKFFSLDNPHTLEAIAYSRARAGNVARAIEELEYLEPIPKPDIGDVRTMLHVETHG